jgi:hypothetical protein
MSDIARNTYDKTRQYRSLVSQQGRVVLEADTNEASMIAAEGMRQEVVDVVGSYGVPLDLVKGERGDGYRIYELNADTRDFRIGTGSLYLGGWRILQDDTQLAYGNLSDWLDGPAPLLGEIHPR